MHQKLKERLGKELLFFDCGGGTTLQKKGLAAGQRPDGWNLEHPDIVRQFHLDCLAAGSDILTSNTFGAIGLRYGEENLRKVIAAGIHLAKEAIAASGKPALVAHDLGPTGEWLEPYGDLEYDAAVALFEQAAAIGLDAGADLLLIETMMDVNEAKAAIEGVRKAGGGAVPVLATLTFEENGRLLSGALPGDAAKELEAAGAFAVGVNCGAGPERALAVLPEIVKAVSIPVIAQPNAGLPRVEGGQAVYDMAPDEFAAGCRGIFDLGAKFMGGCCGTTPAHIAALVKRFG